MTVILESDVLVLQMTALHWAIDSGCDKVINFLISNGVDVNVVDPEGNTPLHFGEINPVSVDCHISHVISCKSCFAKIFEPFLGIS